MVTPVRVRIVFTFLPILCFIPAEVTHPMSALPLVDGCGKFTLKVMEIFSAWRQLSTYIVSDTWIVNNLINKPLVTRRLQNHLYVVVFAGSLQKLFYPDYVFMWILNACQPSMWQGWSQAALFMTEVKFTHDIRVVILSHVSYLLTFLVVIHCPGTRGHQAASTPMQMDILQCMHQEKTEGSWWSKPHLVGKYAS